MTKPTINLLYGNEDDARKFVQEITEEDKVALLSHTDHDGLGAAKITTAVIPNFAHLQFCDYDDLNNQLISELKDKKITKVITTDLFIKERSFVEGLASFADVLIIDHHPGEHDYNEIDRVHFCMVKTVFCAAYMAYTIFLPDFPKLEQLDWVVASSCIADYQYFENQDWMAYVYEKYGESFDVEKIRDSKFWTIQDTVNLGIIYNKKDLPFVFSQIGSDFADTGNLGEHAGLVQAEIDRAVERFASDHEVIGEIMYWKFTPNFGITSLLSNEISGQDTSKLYVLVKDDPEKDHYTMSGRCQDQHVDMGKLLAACVDGFEESNAGGHRAAAGGSIRKEDLNAFKRRLSDITPSDFA